MNATRGSPEAFLENEPWADVAREREQGSRRFREPDTHTSTYAMIRIGAAQADRLASIVARAR